MDWKLICAVLTCAATPLIAQEPSDGRATYVRFCSSCHGPEARGNGPMGPSLTLMPKDLTQLAAENGGVFPTFDVIAKIDGSDPLMSHGSPMPVYGDFFTGKGVAMKVESGQLVMTSQPIVDLVGYLQGIQE